MANILDILNTISKAQYGREVRQAIVDGISQCYADGKAGVNDLQARQLIESAIAVNEDQQAELMNLLSRIEELEGGGSGEGTSESTTIEVPSFIIDSGIIDNITIESNGTNNRTITFSKEFTEIPTVSCVVMVQTTATSNYANVQVVVVKSSITTTGFKFTVANRSGAQRSATIGWIAIQPTTETIPLDITIPDADGMSEVEVREITNPIQTALDGVKTGYDGTVYSTPGEAVRTQINDLHVLIGDEPGTAIDASAIGYGEDSNVEDALDGLNERLSELEDGGVGTTVPTEVRQAIFALFSSGAYAETGLADEIAVVQAWAATVTAIELNKSSDTLDAEETGTLVATTTPTGGAVTWATSDASVATVSNGIVTPVGNGSCRITATSGDRSASCVVTVSGFAELVSIDAVYTPSSDVYTFTDLDDLRSDIVVTATYDDESTAVITNYTLSGSLTQASSPVVVAYRGMTDTINVTVDTSVLYMLPWTEFKSTDGALITDFYPLAEDRDISFAVTFQNKSSNPSADWRLLDFLNTGDTKGLLWYSYSSKHQLKAGGTRYSLDIAYNNTAVHKVVITHAAGSNQAKIYVDGTAVKHTATVPTWIGGENLVFNRGSAGYIGYVSLTAYNKVLSSSEISDFMV